MKDYKYVSVIEAANAELAESLVDSIKLLDSEAAKKRLQYLLNSNFSDASFVHVASQFVSISGVLTSADWEGK